MKFAALLLLLLDTSGRRSPFDASRCGFVRSYAVSEELVFAAAAAPGGQWGACGRRDGAIELFEIATGRKLRTLKGHEGYVYAVAFSPDGRLLASAGADSTVRLWETEGGEIGALRGHGEPVWAVAFAEDGKHLVSAGADGAIVWNVERRSRLRSFGEKATCAAVSGDLVALGTLEGKITLWNLAGASRGVLDGHDGTILSVSFVPGGRKVASSGHGGVVRLWDVDTRQPLFDLKGHEGAVGALVFSGDGRVLASAGRDVRLWDPRSGRLLRRIESSAPATGVAFARSGTSVLATCSDNRLRLWGPPEGNESSAESPPERLKGFLGVSYGNAGGALVSSVVADSQAERVGVQVNDVIVGCDDRKFESSDDFLNFMKETFEGQEVWITLRRDGKDKHVKVKLGRWP